MVVFHCNTSCWLPEMGSREPNGLFSLCGQVLPSWNTKMKFFIKSVVMYWLSFKLLMLLCISVNCARWEVYICYYCSLYLTLYDSGLSLLVS